MNSLLLTLCVKKNRNTDRKFVLVRNVRLFSCIWLVFKILKYELSLPGNKRLLSMPFDNERWPFKHNPYGEQLLITFKSKNEA